MSATTVVIALGICVGLLLACYCFLGFFAYKWTTRRSARYPSAPAAFDYQAALRVVDRTRRGPSPGRQGRDGEEAHARRAS